MSRAESVGGNPEEGNQEPLTDSQRFLRIIGYGHHDDTDIPLRDGSTVAGRNVLDRCPDDAADVFRMLLHLEGQRLDGNPDFDPDFYSGLVEGSRQYVQRYIPDAGPPVFEDSAQGA